MPSRAATLLATLALTAVGTVTAAPAQADVPCTITGFSPRTVSVGVVPVTATFGIGTSGCVQGGWSLEGEDFYAFDDAPQQTFNPFTNSQAGPQDVIATAYNSDFSPRERVFANGFSLKRRSVWQTGSFNASPEPVRKGRAISLKGRLLIADWDNNRWVGYSNRAISVQFRTSTGSYATVKTVTTRGDGWAIASITAQRTGVWRLVYGGNTLASNAITAGDAVSVTG